MEMAEGAGITPIAELQKGSTANVMAVCTADPWRIMSSSSLWKATLKDTSGEACVIGNSEFKFKSNDVVGLRSARVQEYRGDVQLSVRDDSVVEVNPDSEEASILRLWHQNLVSEIQTQRRREGFTPIANLQKGTSAHVLAVCTGNPWTSKSGLTKASLKDATGQMYVMTWNRPFWFHANDVVAAYSMKVREFKETVELEFVPGSDIVVNPELDEVSKLRDWYRKEVSQQMDQGFTPIKALEPGTTANIMAVCTSDPFDHTVNRQGRRLWKVTLRDATGYVNAAKYDDQFDFGLNDVVEARYVGVRSYARGVEVYMDGNTVTTVNPVSEEAAKLKEWHRSQGARACAEPEVKPMEPANLLPSNRQIKCDVCNVWCSGNISYQNHIQGRPHYAALSNKRGADGSNGVGNGTGSGPPAKKRKSGAVQEELKCDVCDISVLTKDAYDAHMKGTRHLKKLKEQEVAGDVSNLPHIVEVPGQGYSCTVCNVTMSGKVVVLSHVKGSKHMRNINAPPKPQTAASTKKEPFECKVCQIFVNSPAVLAQHEMSAKHLAKAQAAQQAARPVQASKVPGFVGQGFDEYSSVPE